METAQSLMMLGYTEERAEKATAELKEISRTYNGEPTAVKTYDGIEIYLR
jgi:hypothetical protein